MPQHSVGKLPLDYLDLHLSDKIKAKKANALQIHEQYLAIKEKRAKTWLPRIFSRSDPFDLNIEKVLKQIENLSNRGKFESALKLADEIYEKGLLSLFYYQRFHRLPLYIATSFTYVGFMILILLRILQEYSCLLMFSNKNQQSPILAVLGVIYSFLATFGQNVPWHYFFYYSSPFLVWSQVYNLLKGANLAPNQQKYCLEMLKVLALSLGIIEFLILAFFDRRFLSIALALLMMVHFRHIQEFTLKLAWILLNLALMVFSFQPSVGKEQRPSLVLLNSVVAFVLASLMIYKLKINNLKVLQVCC